MRSTKLGVVIFAFLACLSFAVADSSTISAPNNNARADERTAEAPTGFDDLTNGFITQAEFNEAMGAFNRHYFERDGLGPVFNGETCLRCHQFPTIGGFSLNRVAKVGKFDGKIFTPHPGGMVIQVAATRPDLKEKVLSGFDIISQRISTSLLGDGYIEAIADDTLRALAKAQPKQSNGKISGEVVEVPILEAPGTKGVGRFGWKSSHASLLSFVGEAFYMEIGLTSQLFPVEITSSGKTIAAFDTAEEPEVEMSRIEMVTRFIRATKAPGRDEALTQTADSKVGGRLFESLGCAICHVPTLQTMPAGTKTNGGKFTVPPALGNKLIHPFSDFLLHDVGTGDGIMEVGGLTTRNKMRTAPLWGLGARLTRLGEQLVLMHDGASTSLEQAILRHAGEASQVTDNFKKLNDREKEQLLSYLKSL